MMTHLNYLDHCLPFTCEDFAELQLLTNHIQKQIGKCSTSEIAIWADVDAISENKHDLSAQTYQVQCNEIAEQTNEGEKILDINALNVSFKSNESFESFNWTLNLSNGEKSSTNGTTKSHKIVENYIDNSKFDCVSDVDMSRKIQAERIIAHSINYNQSYNGLQNMAEIVNRTPNASIQVPSTKHTMKKFVKPDLNYEFHIHCSKCKIYTSSISSKCNCVGCGKKLTTAESNHFVYIPLKQQLLKSINENFARITSYEFDRNNNSKSGVIRDVYDSILHQQAQAKYQNATILPLAINTDGAVVHKCSKKSLWAIQLHQNFLPPILRYIAKNILVVGLYFGEKKPNMHDFFLPLFQELESIYKEGRFCIQRNGKNNYYYPIILQCCCDIPAKVEVQGMVGHNGYYSCGYCLHPGKPIKSKKNSKSFVRYVHQKNPSELRTHQIMLQTYQKIKSDSIMGVKKVSCMIAAKDFDLVNGFCIDYMHCVLLGVVVKLLSLWLDSVNHNSSYYIKPKYQKSLDKRLMKIKPTSNISRKPRPLSDRSNYKANEYRNLLLYYLTYSLRGLLPKQYIDHFKLLSSSIYTFLKKEIAFDEIDDAENKLNRFANEFEYLYGADRVTTNIHLLRHIANSIRYHGPLWAQAAFGFESNNGLLVKTNSKKNILHSIAWKYCMKFTLNVLDRDEEKCRNVKVHGKKKIVISKDELAVLSDFNSLCESENLTIYKSIEVHGERFTSRNSREVATIDYVVKTKKNTICLVKYFFAYQHNLYAMIEPFKVVGISNHLKEVELLGKFEVISISEIEEKLIYMEIGNQNIVSQIPNNYEKT